MVGVDRIPVAPSTPTKYPGSEAQKGPLDIMKYLRILLIIALAIAAGCQTSVSVKMGPNANAPAETTSNAD